MILTIENFKRKYPETWNVLVIFWIVLGAIAFTGLMFMLLDLAVHALLFSGNPK